MCSKASDYISGTAFQIIPVFLICCHIVSRHNDFLHYGAKHVLWVKWNRSHFFQWNRSFENAWNDPHRGKAICLFKNLSHFIQSIALKNQDRIHWREKPLACSKCNKSFTENGRLKTHDNGAKHVLWVKWNRSHFFQCNRSQS